MKRKQNRVIDLPESGLVSQYQLKIRFGEVDSMGIVWHGNYASYFEEGRDDFGAKYDFNLVDIYKRYGLITPLVRMSVDYKLPLKYGDEITIETRLINSRAARLHYAYRIFKGEDKKLATEGETIHVFTNWEGELHLTMPDFLTEWKKRWGLI